MKRLALLFAMMAFVACSNDGIVLEYDIQNSKGNVLKAVHGNDASLCGSAHLSMYNDVYVVDLGTEDGYVDMGAEIGEVLAGMDKFSIQAKYLIPGGFTIRGYGYFLWAFSTLEFNQSEDGRYHACRLNAVRAENSVGGYSNETFMELGQPSEYDRWIELVYTQDGTVGKLYSNGTLIAENDQMYTIAETFSGEVPTFNWIGKAPFKGDRYLVGAQISEFRIYDRVIVE